MKDPYSEQWHVEVQKELPGSAQLTVGYVGSHSVRLAVSEIAEFRKFQTLTGELVDVNRKICRLRPVEQTEPTAQEKKRRRQSNKKSLAK